MLTSQVKHESMIRRPQMPSQNLRLAVAALLIILLSSFPKCAGAFEIFPRPLDQYTVKRGDTLYGIAGYYYNNPSLWPFLWNQNPQINVKGGSGAPQNQPLLPGAKVNLFYKRFAPAVVNQSYAPPTGISDDLRFLVTKVPMQGIPYDKKYFRYKLSNRPVQLWGYIVSSPESEVHKTHFLERDLVYIRFRPSKKQAILVGDRLGIYRDRGPVYHPINRDKPIGWVSEVVGEVEITSTGNELATAIILDSYQEIVRGDKICLFVPRGRELVPTKTHRMLTGTILYSATRTETFYAENNNLENDVLFINRGECDGMREGMLVNIYRATTSVPDPYFNRPIPIPDRYVGEAMILKPFEKNSTIIVTRQREEIIPGDIIKSVSD
jgi:hypothetical protein